MRLSFNIRSLLIVTALAAVAIVFWPQTEVPGSPNLYGRVVDLNGKGIPAVKIKLYGGVATRWLSQETVTDKNGEYKFVPMESGATIIKRPAEKFNSRIVGIQIEHTGYISTDGESWWNEAIPAIQGYNFRRDFTLKPSTANEAPVVENRDD